MTVYIRNNESIDSALDRFHRKVDKSGIIDEYRSKQAYKSKSELVRERELERKKKLKRKRK